MHAQGAHVMEAGETQLPMPSQVLSAVKSFEARSQLGGLQSV
jgi:hypothetical protein